MSDFTQLWGIANTPGEALAQVYPALVQFGFLAQPFGSYSLTGPYVLAYESCYAIAFTWLFSDNSFEFIFAAAQADPDAVPSLREVLETPGVALDVAIKTDSGYAASDTEEAFRVYFVDSKASAIEAMTGCTATVLDDGAIDAAGGAAVTYTSVTRYATDLMTAYQADALRFPSGVGEIFTTSNPYAAPTQPASNVAIAVADLSGLTEAVQAIADQDFEISINQGNPMFSVKGRVAAFARQAQFKKV